MYKYTLTLILNQDKTKVLMCDHQKLGKLNYVGGKIKPEESVMEASYRELFEETGIKGEDTNGLYVFRHEVLDVFRKKGGSSPYSDFDMYISMGVLKHDVELKEEKNPLLWVDVNDIDTLIHANGYGQCYTYLVQGMEILEEFGDRWPIL